MHADSCTHYTGSQHTVCELGIAYARFGPTRWPCWTATPWETRERLALCPQFVLPTQEALDAAKAETDAWIQHAIDRDTRGECFQCGTPMHAKRQVGPCIYVEPCGCRLGQGRLTNRNGKRVPRLVIVPEAMEEGEATRGETR